MTTQHLPKTDELVIRRHFHATPEALYDAWLTPEILATFMGREGTVISDVQIDARVGGSYAITMASCDEGSEPITVRGVYRILDRPRTIACTWGWDEDDASLSVETELSLEFVPHGDETELVLTHVRFRDGAMRDRHHEGWTATLEKLARRFAR